MIYQLICDVFAQIVESHLSTLSKKLSHSVSSANLNISPGADNNLSSSPTPASKPNGISGVAQQGGISRTRSAHFDPASTATAQK